MEVRTIVHQPRSSPIATRWKPSTVSSSSCESGSERPKPRPQNGLRSRQRKRTRRNDDSAGRHLFDARGGDCGARRQGCNHRSKVVYSGRDGLGAWRDACSRDDSSDFRAMHRHPVFPKVPSHALDLVRRAVAETPPSGFHLVALLWSNRRWGLWTCPI
jgi:hypothetical protein